MPALRKPSNPLSLWGGDSQPAPEGISMQMEEAAWSSSEPNLRLTSFLGLANLVSCGMPTDVGTHTIRVVWSLPLNPSGPIKELQHPCLPFSHLLKRSGVVVIGIFWLTLGLYTVP